MFAKTFMRGERQIVAMLDTTDESMCIIFYFEMDCDADSYGVSNAILKFDSTNKGSASAIYYFEQLAEKEVFDFIDKVIADVNEEVMGEFAETEITGMLQ